jgi:peptidoglycan-associated lipoprotein
MKRGALALLFVAAYVGACASDEAGKGGADVVAGGRPGIDSQGNVPGSRPGDVAGGAVKAAWEREVANAADGAGDRVFFQLDRSDLTPQAQETLRHQADWLKRYAAVTVTVEGHADERGTREYNIALGARRASVVVNYLVSRGVNANRIQQKSFGKERPVAICDDISCWSQNRRAVTVVQ